jgi:DNA (cytosine-5)-methyltransferase 3A
VRLKNELSPTYFLLENVPMKKEWRDIISQHLGVEPIVINSARVSAQNRVRYYWTNILAEPFDLFGNIRSTIGQPPDNHILLKDILEPDADPKYTLNGKRLRFMLGPVCKYTEVGGEKSMTLTARMDASWQGSIITLPRGNNKGRIAAATKCGTLTGSSFEHNNFLKLDKDWNPKNNQHKASCFTAGAHSGDNHSDMDIISGGHLYRRLTPVEVERLQTVPDNYTACVSDSQRYKMLGNGWTVDVIAWILSHISAPEKI